MGSECVLWNERLDEENTGLKNRQEYTRFLRTSTVRAVAHEEREQGIWATDRCGERGYVR